MKYSRNDVISAAIVYAYGPDAATGNKFQEVFDTYVREHGEERWSAGAWCGSTIVLSGCLLVASILGLIFR